MGKLISQQAALNLFPEDNLYWDTNDGYLAPHYVRRLLMTLTSTEPEVISKWKKEFREYVGSLDIARDDWKGIIEYIDDVPTVQPERKTGHWIPVTNGRGGHQCDRCGCYAPSYQSGTEWLSNFCPECNADMKGEAE